MKRKTILEQLMKKGLKAKTLFALDDKKLLKLYNRMVNETTVEVNDTKQLKDVQKDAKLKPEDKIKMVDPEVRKQDIKKEMGEGECADCGNQCPKCKSNKVTLLEKEKLNRCGACGHKWGKKMVKEHKKIVPLTTKKQIMEMIAAKMQNQKNQDKNMDCLPDFLGFNNIFNNKSTAAEPITKPLPKTKPEIAPTKPVEKPKRDTPFKPNPVVKPKPKAQMKEGDKRAD